MALHRFRQGTVRPLLDRGLVVVGDERYPDPLFLVGLLIAALPPRSYKISAPPGARLSLSELPSLPDL
jgi:hypothetical protein